ncbi:hypothetical protein TRAPUB_7450 [Trametes pubescens]|uniref:Uncharacterized protein n=1 Tax=Trametes pubescens TaxID=154538 RepID=A0A1M2V3D2_TRAPU|nr:hypothetical protein TRAPUB_7450 [Trametes pubescens]
MRLPRYLLIGKYRTRSALVLASARYAREVLARKTLTTPTRPNTTKYSRHRRTMRWRVRTKALCLGLTSLDLALAAGDGGPTVPLVASLVQGRLTRLGRFGNTSPASGSHFLQLSDVLNALWAIRNDSFRPPAWLTRTTTNGPLFFI